MKYSKEISFVLILYCSSGLSIYLCSPELIRQLVHIERVYFVAQHLVR